MKKISRNITDEVKELGGVFIPWTSSITIRPPEGPPLGLRLSEPCSACCIIDFFLDRPSVVSEGVSLSGHMYADLFVQGLLEPVTDVIVEREYNWMPEHGTSGMDAVVEPERNDGESWLDAIRRSENPYMGHYEFKTTSEDNPKPKGYNRSQVIRQRVVMAREYGITDDQLFNSYIFLIQKSGRQSGKVVGPFLIQPSAEEIAEASMQIDLRIAVYDDIVEEGVHPLDHPLMQRMRNNGTCTRCFPLEKVDATPELESVFKNGREDWNDWIEYQRLDKWIKSVKDKVKPLVPAGKSMETDYFLVRSTESGRLYVDPKNLKSEGMRK